MKEKQMLLKYRDDVLIKEFVWEYVDDYIISNIDIYRTPIINRITIYCLRAKALRKNKKLLDELTKKLKKKFGLENIVFDIREVKEPLLDPNIVAKLIEIRIKKYGIRRFKAIGYNTVKEILNAGARGVEILISGPVTGQLHRTWPFRGGYLPKNGQPAIDLVRKAVRHIKLPRATIGVQVFILPNEMMPDEIKIKEINEEGNKG